MPIDFEVDDSRKLIIFRIKGEFRIWDLIETVQLREEKEPHAANYDAMLVYETDAVNMPLSEKEELNQFLASAWKRLCDAKCAIVYSSMQHLLNSEMIVAQPEVCMDRYGFFETEEEALAWLGK